MQGLQWTKSDTEAVADWVRGRFGLGEGSKEGGENFEKEKN